MVFALPRRGYLHLYGGLAVFKGFYRGFQGFRGLGNASLSSQSDPYNQTLNLKIAAVEPVFTTTAYSSFYSFYSKYATRNLNGTIKTDLNLLNASIVQGWGWSDALRRFLTSTTAGDQYDIVLGRNLSFISEVNVSHALFKTDGTRDYDVLILGLTR